MKVVVYFLLIAAWYFVPTIVATIRHHQVASVAVVNLFLGWTGIGWIVALVMAVRDKPRQKFAGDGLVG